MTDCEHGDYHEQPRSIQTVYLDTKPSAWLGLTFALICVVAIGLLLWAVS